MSEIKKGYVRVSDLLKPYRDFSHIDPAVLEAKCQIGTEVHHAIEQVYQGKVPLVSAGAHMYLEAFKSALTDQSFSGIEPLPFDNGLFLEQRLYNDDLRFTGQIDMVGRDAGGKIHLIDFKTSYKADLPYWKAQMAFYSMLLVYNECPIPDYITILHLKKKGAYSLIPINLTTELLDMCEKLAKAYWHFKR